jgi:hypothetical protein
MVYSGYAAAHILQRDVDEWAQKIEKAGVLVPEYKPVGWLKP